MLKKSIIFSLLFSTIACASNYKIANKFSYTENKDGTITDNITKLIWTKSADLNKDGVINIKDKLTLKESLAYAKECRVANKSDWRVPTIKELYSLINFDGEDINPIAKNFEKLKPFIDTKYFDFAYGDVDAGERIIQSQCVSSTIYTSTTMNGNKTAFGVNFADGRIKGYPAENNRGKELLFYVYLVRGTKDYGKNNFVDNKDGTITDKATSLMWAKNDSSKGLDWNEAVAYANKFTLAGKSGWRLPTVKELQSIVDYKRSPNATKSASIDKVFNCTKIKNEANQDDYAAYWSSTEHKSQGGKFENMCYVNFGRSMGCINDRWIDVHGAGAQRSEPKAGDPTKYSKGRGPQGDAIRIYNYVRLVRDL